MSIVKHSKNSHSMNLVLRSAFNAGTDFRDQVFEPGDCVVDRIRGHRGVVVGPSRFARVRVKFDHGEFNMFKAELRPARPEDSPE